MFNSILVVCVGNICRSPMAEALLRRQLQGKATSVASAGLGALVGHTADPLAQALMAERGIDISPHRARQLGTAELAAVELVLVMEGWQQREIEKKFPQARGKVYRLGHWGDFEIEDPYRKPRQAFEQALSGIEQGIEQWLKRI